MPSKKITHITFDFFGTLVAYTNDGLLGLSYPQAYAFFVNKGLELPYDDFVSQFDQRYISLTKNEQKNEFHMYDMVRLFSEDIGVPLQQKELQMVTHIFLDEWNMIVAQIEGLVPLLEKLRQRYTLAIISNTNFADMVHRNLKTMQASHLFSTVVTSVEHGKRKPHQKIFEDTLVSLQVSPGNTLHVGDSYTADYLGAKNAGMHALLVDEKGKYKGVVKERVSTIMAIEKYLDSI